MRGPRAAWGIGCRAPGVSCPLLRRSAHWARELLGRRRPRRAVAVAAVVLGLVTLVSALPGWVWAAGAGVLVLLWGLAHLAD